MFIAEGRKVVNELLRSGLRPQLLVAEEDSGWSEKEAVLLSPEEFQKWSKLEQADDVFGVFPFPKFEDLETPDLVVILDEIRDPGNLGTIIRTCDWFNVKRVYCTKGSTDVFNSKAVQGSMGSLCRVEVLYDTAEGIYKQLDPYAFACADMNGTSIAQWMPEYPLALILGNESHGPSKFWMDKAEIISIPQISEASAESLNVAIAGAVFLSRLRLG